MKIKIEKISPEMVIDVRHSVLRVGQKIKTAEFDNDYNHRTVHFGGIINDKVISVATIFPDFINSGYKIWQLRGMATLPNYQNRGIGTKLLNKCEIYINLYAGHTIWCNARINAINFYLKNKFVIIGEKFEIPIIGLHYKMEKKLVTK